MGGTGAIWRPLAAGLESQFDILAPDQRGHGDSRIDSATYTPLDYGRDLIETMASLSFHPAWILGHSMGVRTAAAAAHLKPEWVRGLVLVDLGFSGVAGGGLGDGLAQFLKILPLRFASRAQARAFMDANCPDGSITQYLLAVSRSDDTGITFPFDRAALIETIHAARDVSVRKWVEECGDRKLPVHVLRGAESRVWTHDEFLREQEHFKQYPSIVFEEFAGAGHGLPFEKRIELTQLIRDLTG